MQALACGAMAGEAQGGMGPWPRGRFAGSNFLPVKICQFWVQDPSLCRKGSECSFAHGVHELQPNYVEGCGVSRFLHTGMRPTKLCAFYANGACTRSLACTFAHS